MMRNLPPLNSLKAFEAAGRYLSFTHAAEELYVTQGAISKQIKILEEFLGKELFRRAANSLSLTTEGEKYLINITSILDILDKETRSIMGKKHSKTLFTISILPSLSTYWLIPHIKSFQKQNPNLMVKLITGEVSDVSFSSLGGDVGIYVNNKLFENFVNIPLIEEKMCLVCSPSLIEEEEFSIDNISNYSLTNLL